MKKTFLVTTAIDYVNSFPHCGHALEKVQADVIARYHRLLSEEVFFLTGTDENSLKNVRAAQEERIPVRKLVDRNAKKFYELKKALNLSFDDFIRTTEKRHIQGAQKLWLACKKDIYKKKYSGLYCVGCEEFYKEEELKSGLCPEHKIKPELVEEENYFFKLSKYQNKLKKIIETDEIKIIPQTRKNEALSFINSGLEDICISRSAERARGWGIDVPGDPTQKIWVWLEALSNYINALRYGENSKKFQEWWQKNENKLHVIGKGILRFHAIYWPAFLLSAKISLPKTIFVHGYLTSTGQKMSKSLGNVIDPFELVEKYGTDPVRYFLLREASPFDDLDFTFEKFEGRYNSDLAKGLGNLVARVLTLCVKLKVKSEKLKVTVESSKLNEAIKKAKEDSKKTLDDFRFNEALGAIWNLIGFCDRYIEENRPWEKKENQKEIISSLLIALVNIAKLLIPFLPETSEKILKQLGAEFKNGAWYFNPRKEEALFPRK